MCPRTNENVGIFPEILFRKKERKKRREKNQPILASEFMNRLLNDKN